MGVLRREGRAGRKMAIRNLPPGAALCNPPLAVSRPRLAPARSLLFRVVSAPGAGTAGGERLQSSGSRRPLAGDPDEHQPGGAVAGGAGLRPGAAALLRHADLPVAPARLL